MTNNPQQIAIIGAGLSGLTAAHALQSQGRRVMVFDKSKGPGGRCATRRNAAGWFDHGAPKVRARTPEFSAQLQQWQADGVVAPTDGDLCGVGIPFMNAWMRHLAEGVNLKACTHIAAVEQEGRAWRLRGLEGSELQAAPNQLFDAVIVAVPAEQAAPLLAPAPELAEAMRATHSRPCWTVMASWPNPLPTKNQRLHNPDPLVPLAHALCQDHLPGRAQHRDAPQGGTRWVLHAGADWSTQNLDATPDAVTRRLLAALSDTLGVRLARPSWSGAHRWRYAQVAEPQDEPFGWNADLRLGACGDAWCARIGTQGLERAWHSARALARQINSATPESQPA